MAAADWHYELLGHVNHARSQAGVGTLGLNAKLISAAQAHSNDQAARQRMGHDGSDGSDAAARITRHGYTGWRGIAENVARGSKTVREVFDQWMNSDGHRKNMLNGSYTHMGAGYSRGGQRGPYWTTTFGVSSSEASLPSAAGSSGGSSHSGSSRCNRGGGGGSGGGCGSSQQHVVMAGDSLWQIAQAHGTTLERLLHLNPSHRANPDRIYPGQVIKVK